MFVEQLTLWSVSVPDRGVLQDHGRAADRHVRDDRKRGRQHPEGSLEAKEDLLSHASSKVSFVVSKVVK